MKRMKLNTHWNHTTQIQHRKRTSLRSSCWCDVFTEAWDHWTTTAQRSTSSPTPLHPTTRAAITQPTLAAAQRYQLAPQRRHLVTQPRLHHTPKPTTTQRTHGMLSTHTPPDHCNTRHHGASCEQQPQPHEPLPRSALRCPLPTPPAATASRAPPRLKASTR